MNAPLITTTDLKPVYEAWIATKDPIRCQALLATLTNYVKDRLTFLRVANIDGIAPNISKMLFDALAAEYQGNSELSEWCNHRIPMYSDRYVRQKLTEAALLSPLSNPGGDESYDAPVDTQWDDILEVVKAVLNTLEAGSHRYEVLWRRARYWLLAPAASFEGHTQTPRGYSEPDNFDPDGLFPDLPSREQQTKLTEKMDNITARIRHRFEKLALANPGRPYMAVYGMIFAPGGNRRGSDLGYNKNYDEQ